MKRDEIQRYWRRIIDTMNDGLMVIAEDGIILTVNQAFEQLTGYSAGEVIGKPCTILKCDACELAIKGGEGKQWWCALFHPEHAGIKRCRCSILKKDGTYAPILKNASVLREENGLATGAVETLMDISELDRLDNAVMQLSRRIDSEDGFHGIIGESPVMRNVFDIIEKIAVSDAPVIIYGESGTGKDLVARAIHLAGHQKDKPYIQFSCAALNESLLESELFGHTKGSFTGAYRHRIGRFEAAMGGDIFLDEIGDIPLAIQVKLLRVLETKTFERVGDHQPITTDARIITATNKNLEELVAQNKFREDLFFRINVIPVRIPPLRDRVEDIPLLVNTFIQRLRSKTGKNITGLTKEAMDFIMTYHWPGNIRELKSALEYAFVIAEKRTISMAHLPIKQSSRMIAEKENLTVKGDTSAEKEIPSEKKALIAALRQTDGNQTQAARILGINRVTVWNRMRKYGIDLKRELTI